MAKHAGYPNAAITFARGSAMSSSASSFTTASSVSAARSGVLAAVFALFTGIALVGVVGFAPTMEIHNAAHDTRHAAAFPCH
jgi:cobalt transporter subunit CbtB